MVIEQKGENKLKGRKCEIMGRRDERRREGRRERKGEEGKRGRRKSEKMSGMGKKQDRGQGIERGEKGRKG